MTSNHSIKLPDVLIRIRRNEKTGRYLAYYETEPKTRGSGKTIVAAVKNLIGKTITTEAATIEASIDKRL